MLGHGDCPMPWTHGNELWIHTTERLCNSSLFFSFLNVLISLNIVSISIRTLYVECIYGYKYCLVPYDLDFDWQGYMLDIYCQHISNDPLTVCIEIWNLASRHMLCRTVAISNRQSWIVFKKYDMYFHFTMSHLTIHIVITITVDVPVMQETRPLTLMILP